MSDDTTEIRITVPLTNAPSTRLRGALDELAAAIAAEQSGDEVEGFGLDSANRLSIGFERPTTMAPAATGWCIGYSHDFGTGDTSCTINFNQK